MKKKLTILLSLYVFYITGICFAESTVHEKLVQALMSFEKDYPEYKNQAYLTDADGYPTTGDGNRTWQQQMVIILERPNSYPNISKRFQDEFKIQLPTKLGDMTPKMLTWWEKEIMAQAGKVPKGFAHVGGKAQDVSVKYLDSFGKQLLQAYIDVVGLDIIYEKPPKYYVSIEEATLFHCQTR
ncbi:MAG: hypothetical protein ACFNYQ_09000 [Treponema sp.]|jgi:hypothetical protein|uniref:hypothetical protein n=1 Tax=Treponema sp. TaxID=166 RepID=UPI003622F1D4